MKTILRTIATVAMFAFSAPAFAGSGVSLEDVLEAKGVLSKEEVKQVKKAKKDEAKKLEIGGRLYADTAWSSDDPGIKLGNGSEIRAARLFAKGTIGNDWHFKGQYDFADNATSLKDVYIKYTGLDAVVIQLGHFKEPFSMEELTSSRFITFMERGLPNALVPGRQMGATLGGHGDMFTAKAGIFGGSPNDTGVSKLDLTGRLTFAPWHEASQVLHLGAAIKYTRPGGKAISLKARPESHYTAINLVDTGTLTGLKNSLSYNAETAVVYGPVSVQGEYISSKASFDGVRADETFHGFYVLGSWFITGESRFYNLKEGAFGRIHPQHDFDGSGFGAWELAVRYSKLDLEDGLTSGGVEDNLSVGLNWYINSHTRLMANYVHASADRSPAATTVAVNPDIFQMRAQVDF